MSSILNERLAIGQEIAPPLRAIEHNLDAAMEHAGTLLSAIARGRRPGKVPFAVGLEAAARIHTCLGSIVEGGQSIHALHLSLDNLRADFGIPARMFGDDGTKPAEATAEASEAEHIRLVG